MRVKVQAWGNSLGLRIPKAYASALGVRAGSEMEVNVEAGALLAELAPPAQLDTLLAQITDEIEWGEPSGGETW